MSEGDEMVRTALRDAVHAAQRGDIDALELELALVRQLDPEKVGEIGIKLRKMASAVQQHPSYKARPAAQAG